MDLSAEHVEGLALAWRDCLGRRAAPNEVRLRDRQAEALLVALTRIMRKRMAAAASHFGESDRDDVAQAFTLGLIKAIANYDPAKSRFVTHATWAIRAALSELRWQLYPDSRAHNKERGFRTVAIPSLAAPGEDDAMPDAVAGLADHDAEERVEASASDHLAELILERQLVRARAVLLARGGRQASVAELAIADDLARGWIFDDATAFARRAAGHGLSAPAARRKAEAHLALGAVRRDVPTRTALAA